MKILQVKCRPREAAMAAAKCKGTNSHYPDRVGDASE